MRERKRGKKERATKKEWERQRDYRRVIFEIALEN